MRKIKEVLRLRNELKLDQRQIARSCSISVSTVHEYLKRAEAVNLVWPLPDGWNDARLEAALFPPAGTPPQPSTKRSPPDFAAIHEQLQRHRHVTLQLVWEEYRDANPNGYGYSRYVAAGFMLRDHLNAMTDARIGGVHRIEQLPEFCRRNLRRQWTPAIPLAEHNDEVRSCQRRPKIPQKRRLKIPQFAG
jgi:hypothetical protein